MKLLAGIGVIGLLIGFGVGVLAGRQFPAHHFERFGTSRYLLDSATGKICDPLPKLNALDQALTATPPPGFSVQSPSVTIGPCEK